MKWNPDEWLSCILRFTLNTGGYFFLHALICWCWHNCSGAETGNRWCWVTKLFQLTASIAFHSKFRGQIQNCWHWSKRWRVGKKAPSLAQFTYDIKHKCTTCFYLLCLWTCWSQLSAERLKTWMHTHTCTHGLISVLAGNILEDKAFTTFVTRNSLHTAVLYAPRE